METPAPGCLSIWFNLVPKTPALPQSVAPHSTVTDTVALSMPASSVDQDACQGTTPGHQRQRLVAVGPWRDGLLVTHPPGRKVGSRSLFAVAQAAGWLRPSELQRCVMTSDGSPAGQAESASPEYGAPRPLSDSATGHLSQGEFVRQQAAQMKAAGRATAFAAHVVIAVRDGRAGAPLNSDSAGRAA